MVKYSHLTLEEREKIYLWKNAGKSFREIGRLLNRDHKTISKDWKEGTKHFNEYIPCKVHKRSQKRASNQRTRAPLKHTLVWTYVRKNLKNGWSPELIAGRLSIDHPGESIHFETIYAYIYGKGKEFKLWQYLDRSHKRRRTKGGRKNRSTQTSSKIPGAVSIEERPQKVNNRNQVGHMETDLMEGNKQNRAVISIDVERKTRYVILTKMPDKTSKNKLKSMEKKLKMILSLSKSNRPLVKSVTYDNGSENVIHREVAKMLGVRGYFCHAYHSWEKGSVENRIIQIRKFIPKGECIEKYTDEQIQMIENWINERPMKCLGYLKPKEAFELEANKYKFRKYEKSLQPNLTKWGTSTSK